MGLCLLYGIADKMASFPKEILICQFPSQAIQKSSKKARRLAGPLALSMAIMRVLLWQKLPFCLLGRYYI